MAPTLVQRIKERDIKRESEIGEKMPREKSLGV